MKCPVLLYNFNQIWCLSTSSYKSSQYKILRKSLQWEPKDGRTDEHDEGDTHI